ncbi:MAG: phosphoenolpyruvate carboxykinase (ATP) [Elusimicrobiota bacterium]|jgi:phosphoenolpyruvate carboxykinase (ATP)
MNTTLEPTISTPAQAEAGKLASENGLELHGIQGARRIYWNLPTEALVEEALHRREGRISEGGAFAADTGRHTSRAAGDKFIVQESSSEKHVWWGSYNRPIEPDRFEAVYRRLTESFRDKDLFVQDCWAGADAQHRLPVRIITEKAWHSHFARNMFIKPASASEYRSHKPEFTVISAPSVKADPKRDGTLSETFILLNFQKRVCIIGDTAYAGEIKKSVFTILNYLLPLKGVFPMHCSANIGAGGDAAIFFGLSGTGKTTLSADPLRRLVGDDEHGWSDKGVFNFEDGCYAKVIRLSPKAEPEIYAATKSFGTVLENVVYDPCTRKPDLDDDSRTENTRASYPLSAIGNSVPEKSGGHPKNVVFLTCDASGVLPPISKLSPDQALYQFISGYTSKVGGTEKGVGKDPEPTFSTCFGAPFMVHHPAVYADMLKKKIAAHGSTCWLLNTGWTGGPYGTGKRISIGHTRTLLNAALSGKLAAAPCSSDPVFGFSVPKVCEGIPADLLDPAASWKDKDEYMRKYKALAAKFAENFKKFQDKCPAEVRAAGPRI